ncbi:MAG TPA: amidohydrolase [Planctomycetota bacterium]|nr:amidohydrolase [Planctomycetota bacterium]
MGSRRQGSWLRNGHFRAAADGPVEGALLVVDERVSRLGGEEEVGRAARELIAAGVALEEVDLGGGWAVPGLRDGHGHLELLARRHAVLDLRACGDERELVACAAAEAARRPAGEWIRGQGWGGETWVGPEPGHGELSRNTPDNPVLLTRVDEHAALVNRAALGLCGLDADAGGQKPEALGADGRVEVDRDGRPTGILLDGALRRMAALVPRQDAEARRSNLYRAREELLGQGLVGVHDMAVGQADLQLLRTLCAEPDWGLDVSAWLWGPETEDPEYLAGAGVRPGERPRTLEVCGLKIFLDGALGSRGAALLAPYSDAPAEQGLLMLERAEVLESVRRGLAAGLAPALHAIGDRANRLALDVFEELRRDGAWGPRLAALRPRIEHAQVVAAADLSRFDGLDLTPAVQPAFALSDGPWLEERLGPERLAGAYAWSRLASDPGQLALGSDFPVEEPAPLRTLRAARTWAAPGARPLAAGEALTAHTLGVARAAGQERWRGLLAPGYDADVSVFDGDPLGPADELRDLCATHTVVRGKVLYRRH